MTLIQLEWKDYYVDRLIVHKYFGICNFENNYYKMFLLYLK